MMKPIDGSRRSVTSPLTPTIESPGDRFGRNAYAPILLVEAHCT